MQTSGNSGLWKSTTRLVRSELLHFLSTVPLLPLAKVSPTVSQNHFVQKWSRSTRNILGASPSSGRAAARAESATQPQQHWELRLLLSLVLTAAPRAALGMLCCHAGLRCTCCGQKAPMRCLTFAQKEQTPPLLEAGSTMAVCSVLGWGQDWLALLISTINIFTQNGMKEHQTWVRGCCEEWRMNQNSMGNKHKPMLNVFF